MNIRAGRCRINYDFLGLLPSRTVPDEAARQVNRPAAAAKRNMRVSWRDYSGWCLHNATFSPSVASDMDFFFQSFILLYLQAEFLERQSSAPLPCAWLQDEDLFVAGGVCLHSFLKKRKHDMSANASVCSRLYSMTTCEISSLLSPN